MRQALKNPALDKIEEGKLGVMTIRKSRVGIIPRTISHVFRTIKD